MLRDSVVVVVVVERTRPRAIPLAMITIRKSFTGFLFFPVMTMGLRLAALRAAGAPLLMRTLHSYVILYYRKYSDQHDQCNICIVHDGKVGCNTIKYIMAFLYSDWLIFYSLV